jgi:hypothetical protein
MDPRESATAVPDGGSPRQRFRLFEAATEALVIAAEPNGLLVLLDDLQWADSASVRLVVHLSMALARSRLMVLVTHRDTETRGQDALRTAVTALAREPAVTRIRLVGLSEPEVAAHLAGVTGWEVPASVVAAVCRRHRATVLRRRARPPLTSSIDGQLPDGYATPCGPARPALPRAEVWSVPPPCWGPNETAAAPPTGSRVDEVLQRP